MRITKAKKKVLLIQLPFPRFSLGWIEEETTQISQPNIPIAAGYLKAMAYKRGLLERIDVELLDTFNRDFDSDAKLIDIILSKKPEILGFSLYVWNSLRSLYVAKKVKEKMPNLKIIVGGPEVTIDLQYILYNPAIDIGVIGEGELAFVEIMHHILDGQPDLDDIKGIFYRKDGHIVITSKRERIKNLDEIPSPYLLGIIDPRDYRKIYLEAMRGCPYKCKYCTWGTLGQSYALFSIERIRKELELAIDKGVSQVSFIDANFNASPNFKSLCKAIKEINTEKKLRLSCQLRYEYVNEEVANLLQECGFEVCSLGLQSTNPIALANINRQVDLTKFLRSVKLLDTRDVHVRIDAIIGLPGDTLEDIKATVKFLKDNNLYDRTNMHVLEILPGTELRGEVERYGIKYQEEPPYVISETAFLSRQDLQEVIDRYYGGRRDNSFPYSLTYSLTAYSRPNYPYRMQEIVTKNPIVCFPELISPSSVLL